MSIQDQANELSALSSELPVEMAQELQHRIDAVLAKAANLLGGEHAANREIQGLGARSLNDLTNAITTLQQLGQTITDSAARLMASGQ